MLLPRQFLASAVALLASSSLVQDVAAQVHTDCQPMNVTCPSNPALGTELYTHFNTTPKAALWENNVGSVTYDKDAGAMFTINKQGDSPTLRSKFYFFWGRSEIWLKASPGKGIVSSVMFLSDTLDEVDWEFVGGNPNNASTNYFGKGVEEFTHGGEHIVGGVQDAYHNYTIVWTKEALDFYINGNLVRKTLAKDAGNHYPQTPMRVNLGIWAGGDPRNQPGVVEWAGGPTDYSKGPYTMYVKSAHVEDYTSGKEYTFTDKTGSWESIRVTAGESKAVEVITAPPEKSVADKWNELPSTAKTAIYASAAGLGTVLVAFAIFFCIRQRRHGSRQAKIAEAKYQEERLELERFKQAGINPDSFVASGHEYNAKEMRDEGLADGDSYSVPNTAAATPTTGTGNEKWQTAAAMGVGAAAGAGAASAGAMRSAEPLLRDGAPSPRSPQASPFNAPYSDRPTVGSAGFTAPYSERTANTKSPPPSMGYGGARSPPPMGDMRTQSPAMSPVTMASGAQQNYPPQPSRSFTSPGPAPVRMTSPPGSPQQQQPGFNVAHPQPQRSFTTTGYNNPQQGGFDFGGQQGGFGGQQGGNAGGWNQGEQGYWNGGHR